ncbi:MAG TPA: hypothetical protein VK043_04310 [Burkholderiales bacterium]|nr:hypothetical protein [Burkholderiales bacterium]
MGKLAERLADATRSGVYRVEATEALEEASALNGFVLERIELRERADAEQAAARAARPDGHVFLFTGARSLASRDPAALERLLGALRAAAAASRSAGERYFVAFLDAPEQLSLEPLYNRRRSAAAGGTALAQNVS